MCVGLRRCLSNTRAWCPGTPVITGGKDSGSDSSTSAVGWPIGGERRTCPQQRHGIGMAGRPKSSPRLTAGLRKYSRRSSGHRRRPYKRARTGSANPQTLGHGVRSPFWVIAAHPMLTSRSQGASSAVEDGYVLAEAIARIPDAVEALRAYEARRRPRAGKLVRSSRRLNRVEQAQNPVTCAARNLGMRCAAGRALIRHTTRPMRFDLRWTP